MAAELLKLQEKGVPLSEMVILFRIVKYACLLPLSMHAEDLLRVWQQMSRAASCAPLPCPAAHDSAHASIRQVGRAVSLLQLKQGWLELQQYPCSSL